MPPLHTAQAVHEAVTEEYRILDSVNFNVGDLLAADWVCLFETRFSLSVEHLRQRFPQGSGSLLSPLARVLSGLLASVALCLPSDFCPRPPTLPGVHAKPHRDVCLVPFVLGLGQLPAVWGSLRVKPRWLGPPPSTRCAFCLWRLFRTCEAGGFFMALFFSSQFEPVD